MLGATRSKFARIKIERVHQKYGPGEIAMRSQPGIHRGTGLLIAPTHCNVWMKRPELHVEAECEQRVVDLLAELMQPRMSGTHANPQHARWTFLRKSADALDGQDEGFNAHIREPLRQCFLRVRLNVAEETQGDMKLFDGRPAHMSRRRLQCGNCCTDGLGQRDGDKQAL